LLAGHVDDAVALVGEGGRRLGEQRRLADAWVTPDQQRGAAHEAAAGRPVELVDAAGDSRRIVDVSGKRGQCHWPTLARTAQALRPGADAAGGTLLDRKSTRLNSSHVKIS